MKTASFEKGPPLRVGSFLFQSGIFHTTALLFNSFFIANQSSKKTRLGTITPSTSTKGVSGVSANIAAAFASTSGMVSFLTKMFSIFLFSIIVFIGNRYNKVIFVCENKVCFASLPPLFILYHKMLRKSIFRYQKTKHTIYGMVKSMDFRAKINIFYCIVLPRKMKKI